MKIKEIKKFEKLEECENTLTTLEIYEGENLIYKQDTPFISYTYWYDHDDFNEDDEDDDEETIEEYEPSEQMAAAISHILKNGKVAIHSKVETIQKNHITNKIEDLIGLEKGKIITLVDDNKAKELAEIEERAKEKRRIKDQLFSIAFDYKKLWKTYFELGFDYWHNVYTPCERGLYDCYLELGGKIPSFDDYIAFCNEKSSNKDIQKLKSLNQLKKIKKEIEKPLIDFKELYKQHRMWQKLGFDHLFDPNEKELILAYLHLGRTPSLDEYVEYAHKGHWKYKIKSFNELLKKLKII